jgi:hypothetical protein
MAGCGTQVDALVDEPAQVEPLGQRGRQQEASIGDQLRAVERDVEPVKAVGRSHPAGAPLIGSMGASQRHRPRSGGHLFFVSRIVNHQSVGGSGISAR